MSNSLLGKAGRRFAQAMRDTSEFVDTINAVKEVVVTWRRRVNRLNEKEIESIQTALDALRSEVRSLATEMEIAEHKLEEDRRGESVVDKLASGATLLQEGNRPYLVGADPDGLAEYLNAITPETARKAFKKVDRDKLADLLRLLEVELGG